VLLALNITLNAQNVVPEQCLSSITADELSGHIYKLASPAFEGRYTGSEGIRLAAEYIRSDFKKMGLESKEWGSGQPFFQAFSLNKCYWQDQQLTMDEVYLSPISDYFFISDPQEIDGQYEVVYSGFGLDDEVYSDYTDIEVTGKLVVAFSGEPKDREGKYFISGQEKPSRKSYYFSKMKLARDKGAAGLIIISSKDKDYRKYTKGMDDYRSRPDINYPGARKDNEGDTFFTLFVSQKAAADILGIKKRKLLKARNQTERERLSKAGVYEGRLDVTTTKECYPMNTENVIGYVEGSDLKDEAVIVVAHYDHLGKKGDDIFFGADDNATGTAAVMEIAEAFTMAKKEGNRPRRTVIFMAVSAEEIGLHGSRYYTENPIIPLEKTFACVNIDMIGRVGSRYGEDPNYVGGWAYVSEDMLDIACESIKQVAPEFECKMNYRERVSGGSDHYYFARSGVPSLFYFTGIHEDYHEPTDTPDKILYDRMEGITRSIFAAVWQLANREEKLGIKN
jgi:hypothetical protein